MIDYIFWCAQPVTMMVIAACMIRGRLHRDFPYFFNYVVFQIAAFGVEFPLRNWVNYFYLYWAITALGIFVSFAALVEIVQKIAGQTKALRHRSIALLCWCALGTMVAIAMWPFISSLDNVTNGIFVADRTVRFMQFALAFFLAMFGAGVGLSKRTLVFGIAMGFGLFAMVNLFVMTLLSHRSLLSKATFSRISSTAYLLSTLIWLVYVAAAAKEDSSSRLTSAT